MRPLFHLTNTIYDLMSDCSDEELFISEQSTCSSSGGGGGDLTDRLECCATIQQQGSLQF